jgi:dipeptidyl-peptidase-4
MGSGDRATLDDLEQLTEGRSDAPGSVRFAPDGRSLTYLFSADGSLVRSLWRHDLLTGERSIIASPLPQTTSEESLSLDEHLQRERTRTSELGVTDYAWASDAPEPTLLVPQAGLLFVGVGSELEGGLRALPGVDGAQAPLLSPDGSWVACVLDGDLYVTPVRGGTPRRLTDEAEPGVFNGLADYVAAEELDRFEGAWWSADSRAIAFEHTDERGVPAYPVTPDELHRYPFAGGPNARVSLRVASLAGAPAREVNLGMRADDYLARVVRHPEGGWLVAVLPGEQRALRWLRVGADASARALWVEEADPWINLDDLTRILPDGRILTSSERSGFRHLELRTSSGDLDRVLTAGDWVVTGVAATSTARGEVLFSATHDGVLERHLYAVPLDARQPVTDPLGVSVEPGWHEFVAQADGERWIDTWSDLEHAARVNVTARDGGSVRIHEPLTTAAQEGLDPPELIELVAADGTTPIHAAVYRAGRHAGGGEPAPGVVWVYGGPHKQYVQRSWEMTAEPLRQYLAQSGAAVVVVDNRGTPDRGVAFESVIDGALGWNEVADQAAAVRQLQERGVLRQGGVGIYGGSYGGFMTLMAMAREPELFSVGVAIAPVTDWGGYDTAYTERYLGTPADHPEAYRRASALARAADVRGSLLLIHGTFDENVHLSHSTRLVDAFRSAGREVELVELPGQRHRARGPAIRVRDARTAVHLLDGLGLPLPDELRRP